MKLDSLFLSVISVISVFSVFSVIRLRFQGLIFCAPIQLYVDLATRTSGRRPEGNLKFLQKFPDSLRILADVAAADP